MIGIDQLIEYAQTAVPDDTAIAGIAFLAQKQRRLERAVERRKKLLALTEQKLARVAELELPDAMSAVGMAEFTLEGGYMIRVGKEYYANIPSPDSDKPELLARRADCFDWLRQNNSGDLIKQQIVIEAGRGEEAKASRVKAGLDKAGIDYKNTESVHGSTLKAFVKEQLEKEHTEGAAPFPEKLFGVHVKRVASIKPAKKK